MGQISRRMVLINQERTRKTRKSIIREKSLDARWPAVARCRDQAKIREIGGRSSEEINIAHDGGSLRQAGEY